MRLPVVMLIAMIAVTLMVDCYIFFDMKRRIGDKMHPLLVPFRQRFLSPPWIYIYATLACLALLITALSLPRRGDATLLPVWWMLYIYITIYAGKLGYVIGSLIGRIPCMWRGIRNDTRMWLGLPLCALFVFTMAWGALIGRRHIEVKEVSILSNDLPANFDGYRILHFSDAHVDTWSGDTIFVSQMVDRINSLQPDLIVFSGDIVSRRTSEIYPYINVLKRLNATDGVVSVLGNHDYGDYFDWSSPKLHQADIEEIKSIQTKKLGWNLLCNQSEIISHGGDSIRIAGVENWGEPPFKKYGNLEQAYPKNQRHKNEFVILVSHNPMHWHQFVSKSDDIDFTLSGHTHAMQCQFSIGNYRFSPAQWRYPEWSGLYSTHTKSGRLSQLYVNIGCGEVAMPARLGTAFPELTLITLHCNHDR